MREAGQATDSSRGNRWMQTLRKLPMTAPNKNTITYDIMSKLVATDPRSTFDVAESYMYIILIQ
jgi:hypothetical protein